jgi:hypothetical protein
MSGRSSPSEHPEILQMLEDKTTIDEKESCFSPKHMTTDPQVRGGITRKTFNSDHPTDHHVMSFIHA